ncbi:hypothetical protein FRB95_003564 [Tulasnella sp. JGI-2019a]|nr:hypothetical protein FRB95_003564 [Tulasnella sp. JGI-2019a]
MSVVVQTTIYLEKRGDTGQEEGTGEIFPLSEFRVADPGDDEQFYAKERELWNKYQKAAETGDAIFSDTAKMETKKNLRDGPLKNMKFYSTETAHAAGNNGGGVLAMQKGSSFRPQSDAKDGPTVQAQLRPRDLTKWHSLPFQR